MTDRVYMAENKRMNDFKKGRILAIQMLVKMGKKSSAAARREIVELKAHWRSKGL